MKKTLKKIKNFLDFVFFYRYLAKNRLKKLYFKDFFSLTGNPDIETIPWNKKVCVISPDIDDDVIGCGGFITLLKKNNCPVSVYYVDGESDTRRKEAEKLKELFIYEEVIFGKREKIDFSFMLDNKFEIILLPDYFDNHHFHHTVTKKFFEFLNENYPRLKHSVLYFYEIWSPLIPNVIVDITSVIEMKKEYIKVFVSQLAAKDYVHGSIGLNQYRSLHYPVSSCSYAEAFFKVPSEQMVLFMKWI